MSKIKRLSTIFLRSRSSPRKILHGKTLSFFKEWGYVLQEAPYSSAFSILKPCSCTASANLCQNHWTSLQQLRKKSILLIYKMPWQPYSLKSRAQMWSLSNKAGGQVWKSPFSFLFSIVTVAWGWRDALTVEVNHGIAFINAYHLVRDREISL